MRCRFGIAAFKFQRLKRFMFRTLFASPSNCAGCNDAASSAALFPATVVNRLTHMSIDAALPAKIPGGGDPATCPDVLFDKCATSKGDNNGVASSQGPNKSHVTVHNTNPLETHTLNKALDSNRAAIRLVEVYANGPELVFACETHNRNSRGYMSE